MTSGAHLSPAEQTASHVLLFTQSHTEQIKAKKKKSKLKAIRSLQHEADWFQVLQVKDGD